MAEARYTPAGPSSSSSTAHGKRSYHDMAPESDSAPSAARTGSSSSSSSSPADRDRNKRPRNDNESAYASEVEDILLSSNTSVSSSSSGSSYHSARSNLAPASPAFPALDPVGEGEEDLSDVPSFDASPDSFSFDHNPDVLMEDNPPFVPPPLVSDPDPATSHAPLPESNLQSSNDQFRRSMERADAFDREMAAIRVPSQPPPPPVWASWSPDSSSISDNDAFWSSLSSTFTRPSSPPTSRHDLLEPHYSVFDYFDDRVTRYGNSIPPDDDLLMTSPPDGGHPIEPNSSILRRRLAYERDAARLGDTVGRLRARENLLQRMLTANEASAQPSIHSTFHVPFRRTERTEERSYQPTYQAGLGPRLTSSNLPPVRPPTHYTDARSLADDSWRRFYDREERDIDRVLRDGQAHVQRTAQSLGDGESALRSSAARPAREDPPASSVSSSYSTLRGALDDSAIRGRTHYPYTQPLSRPPEAAPSQSSSTSAAHSRVRSIPDAAARELAADASRSFAGDSTADFLRQSERRWRLPLARRLSRIEDMYDLSPIPSEDPSEWMAYPSETSARPSRDTQSEALRLIRRRRVGPTPSSPSSIGTTAPTDIGTAQRVHWFDALDSRSQESSSAGGVPRSSAERLSPISPRNSGVFFDLQPFRRTPGPTPLPPLADTSARRQAHINPSAFRAGPIRETMARSAAFQAQGAHSPPERPVEASRYPLRRRRAGRPATADSSSSDDDAMLRRHLDGVGAGRAPAARPSLRSSPMLTPMEVLGLGMPLTDNAPSPRLAEPRRASMDARERDDRWTTWSSSSRRSPERPSRDPPPEPPSASPRLRDLLSTNRTSVPLPPLRSRSLLNRERALANLGEYFTHDPAPRTAPSVDRWEHRRNAVRRARPSRVSDNAAASSGSASDAPTSSAADPPPAPPPRSASSRWISLNSPFGGMDEWAEIREPGAGRLHARRLLGPADIVWVDRGNVRAGHPHHRRRHFDIGDYMRDEDFDMSYEGLLGLSALLGDVKSRGTAADIIAALPKGTYAEWSRPGETGERCPICLDDYQANDACMRVPACSHWFHDGCLQQWLKGARTCPVCRGRVARPRSTETATAGPSGSNSSNNRNSPGSSGTRRDDDDDQDESESDGDRTPRSRWSPFRPPWRHD